MSHKILILLILSVFILDGHALDNKNLDAALTNVQEVMSKKDFKSFVALWDPNSASGRALAKIEGSNWGKGAPESTVTFLKKEELFTDANMSIARVLSKEVLTEEGNPSKILLEENSTRILIFRIKEGKYLLYEITAFDIAKE